MLREIGWLYMQVFLKGAFSESIFFLIIILFYTFFFFLFILFCVH